MRITKYSIYTCMFVQARNKRATAIGAYDGFPANSFKKFQLHNGPARQEAFLVHFLCQLYTSRGRLRAAECWLCSSAGFCEAPGPPGTGTSSSSFFLLSLFPLHHHNSILQSNFVWEKSITHDGFARQRACLAVRLTSQTYQSKKCSGRVSSMRESRKLLANST
jgi:hypothetical protein